MLSDISINNVVNRINYIIAKIIELSKDNVIVFDFDGTMIEVQHANNRILPCVNEKLNEYAKDVDIYANIRPLGIMQYISAQIDDNSKYIMTVSKPNVEEQKTRYINKHFQFQQQNVIHLKSPEQKILQLSRIYEKHKLPIVFIDDDLEILIKAEETLPYVQGLHVSHFIY